MQEVSLDRRLGWIIRDNGQLGLSDRDTSSVGTNCHSYKNELAALRLSYIHSSWEQAKTWWVRQQAKNHSSSLLAAAILYYNTVCLPACWPTRPGYPLDGAAVAAAAALVLATTLLGMAAGRNDQAEPPQKLAHRLICGFHAHYSIAVRTATAVRRQTLHS